MIGDCWVPKEESTICACCTPSRLDDTTIPLRESSTFTDDVKNSWNATKIYCNLILIFKENNNTHGQKDSKNGHLATIYSQHSSHIEYHLKKLSRVVHNLNSSMQAFLQTTIHYYLLGMLIHVVS